MKYFQKMVGQNIYLSPINLEDLEIYTNWLNNKLVAENTGFYGKNFTLESEKAILERLSQGHTYAIIAKEGNQLLGNAGLESVDNINRTAEIGIFIGEEAKRSKGYGSEALKLLLEYGFKTLNLNNIMLKLNATNERALKCYEKMGFQLIGHRTAARYIDGKYIDMIYMEILKKDWPK